VIARFGVALTRHFILEAAMAISVRMDFSRHRLPSLTHGCSAEML
jgi:hypothetical protein